MWKFRAILSVALAVLFWVDGFGKQPLAAERLQQVARAYLDKKFEFDPVYATEMGEHGYDDRYPDFSSRSYGKMAAALRDIKGELKKVNQGELSTSEKIDYMLIDGSIEADLLKLSRSLLMLDNPKLFSSKAVDGVYLIMLSQSLSDTAKLETILDRLRDLPRFLASAGKLLKEPPQIWLLLAQEEADKAVGLLNDVSAYFCARFPELQTEIQGRIAEATNAMEDFSDLLETFKSREGQPFAVGKDFYDKLLKSDHFIDFDADSLLKLGEALYAQATRNYDSVSLIVDSLPEPEELVYFIPRSFNRSDILDYFQWEINQTRDWVAAHDYATVPTDIGACVPVETPVFLRNVIGGIAYQPPGPFEPVQTGRFYVRPLPDTLGEADRSAFFRYCFTRGFRSSAVHEAYPGHHLQIQIANRNPSLIRRILRNNLMIEGWALYCEEDAYRQGFYGDDLRTYLGILGGIRFRAARMIVDVKLHTGQFTYQQAVDWMVENLDASVDYVESEVNRYTLTPAQPMTYLMGKQILLEIRELYRVKMGTKYTPGRFHDFLLKQGGISPVLILKELSGQIF